MGMYLLRRNGIPIVVWLGTKIMEPSITPNSDNVASKSPAPPPLKQAKPQYGIEEGTSLYRRVIDYLSLRSKENVTVHPPRPLAGEGLGERVEDSTDYPPLPNPLPHQWGRGN